MRGAPIATVMLVVALCAVAFAACGSSSPGITDDASQQLELRVAAVRNAAAALDRTGAERALADLRRGVEELRGRDEISASRRSKVLEAAAAVEAQLQSIPTTTTTTTTTTTLPPQTREKNEDRRKGQNGGKGGDGGGGD